MGLVGDGEEREREAVGDGEERERKDVGDGLPKEKEGEKLAWWTAWARRDREETKRKMGDCQKLDREIMEIGKTTNVK